MKAKSLGETLVYTSERECAEVHKKKCHIFSHAPWPEQGAKQGRAPLRLREQFLQDPIFPSHFIGLGIVPRAHLGREAVLWEQESLSAIIS